MSARGSGRLRPDKTSVSTPLQRTRILPLRRSAPTVGIVKPCYGYERVSYGLPVRSASFRRVFDLPLHRLEREGTFWSYTPCVLDADFDLLHTWNAIPLLPAPFIVSFENELPRYLGRRRSWQYAFGERRLASRHCKRILALSETSATNARDTFRKKGREELAARIEVFRGGVSLPSFEHVEPHGEWQPSERPLTLLFVGGNAFPKAIVPLIEALKQLRREGANLLLTVVGQLHPGGHVMRHLSPDVDHWNQVLESEEWITHHRALPNRLLLEEMVRHDMFLLPSFDESLGWGVVEAGLCGTPAVVTNVFALPELVDHEKTGFVIDLELGRQSRWSGIWADDAALEGALELANASIRNGVKQAVEKVLGTPALIDQWGAGARERMRGWYDPENASRQLESIYTAAFDS